MIPTTEAQELETRILRRIEDVGLDSFGPTEVLDAVKSAMGSLYTSLRLANKYHDTDYLELSPGAGTTIRQNVTDFQMPETVSDVVEIKGQRSTGRWLDLLTKVPPQWGGQSSGLPVWHWVSARTGRIRIYGRLNRYNTLHFFIVRKWPPMHYGTAAGGAASTITFDATPTAGNVILRDDVYIGVDLLITNNTPPGVEGQIGRVTDYVGSTRIATVRDAWTVVPDVTTNYGLVVPIPEEYEEMLIEESAQILKEELGEGLPISPRLGFLRDQFEQGLSQRDGEPARRVWSRGGI